MPRDSAGTYTLPAGNPVVTLSVISSTWANTTLSDLSTAMTASLSRSGQGAMLAGLKLFDGTIGAPGLTWSTETTSGLYRASAGNFRWSIGGVDVFTITAAGISGVAIGLFGNGTAAAPSISFTSDPDTGIYRIGANILGFAAAGVEVFRLDAATAITSVLAWRGPDGTAASPAFSFSADPDTGIYRVGANNLGIAAAGVNILDVNATRIVSAVNIEGNSGGTVATPAFSFSGDNDTGIYRVGANNLGIATGGALRLTITDTIAQFQNAVQVQVSDGSVGTPAYSFSGDTDIGFFRAGSNNLAVTVGGVQIMNWAGNGIAVGTGQFFLLDGTAALPGLTFAADSNTGIYRIGADNLGISTNGVLRWDVSTTAVTSTLQRIAPLGSAGGPSYSFTGDTNTGIYSSGADAVTVAGGGTQIANFATTTTSITAGTFTVTAATTAQIDTPLMRHNGIHNGTAPTGAANQYVASGTYTGTATATTNLDATTPLVSQWLRVGNVVTVSGEVTVDATAAALTSFELSLPIASNLAGTNQLTGSGLVNAGPPGNVVSLRGSAANDTAIFTWVATGTTSTNLWFHFTYLVV